MKHSILIQIKGLVKTFKNRHISVYINLAKWLDTKYPIEYLIQPLVGECLPKVKTVVIEVHISCHFWIRFIHSWQR